MNDSGSVLPGAERQKLELQLKRIEEKTTAQVVVLTVKSLEGEDFASFSIKVARAWALGQKGKNNGILITLAVKENRVRMEVGYGLEGAIPDSVALQIIGELQSRVTSDKKEYYSGLTNMIEALSRRIILDQGLAGSTEPSSSEDEEGDDLLLLFLIPLVLAALAGSFHPVAGGLVGGVLAGLIGWALYTWWIAAVICVVGFFVCLFARPILEILPMSGVSFGSGRSIKIFSGKGGKFGGGGADD